MTTPTPLPTTGRFEELFPSKFMERGLDDFRDRSLWRNRNCKEDENFRHFCKICKRRFACGRALGGHMRIHGAAAEKSKAREEEERSSQDGGIDKNGGSSYALRANRKRSWVLEDRSYGFVACDECGKEFSSWKAMLQHIRCDHSHSQFSPDGFGLDSQEEQILDIDTHNKNTEIIQAPKGKRSKRVRTSEEDPENSPTTSVSHYNEEEDMANCLVMLSSFGGPNKKKKSKKGLGLGTEANVKSHYKCKTCGKVFSSFQALGGHRASHKNLRGCSSKAPEGNVSSEEEIVTSDEDLLKAEADCADKALETQKLNKEENSCGKARLHECSICHRNFPSGQALGGHKRCHWSTGEASVSSLQKTDEEKRPHGGKLLDLNLPAPVDDEEDYKQFEIERTSELKNMEKNFFVGFHKDYPYQFQPWWNGKSDRSLSCHDQTHVDDEAESKKKEFG